MTTSLLQRLTKPGPKRILSLDGGGVRGILILGFLERLEEELRMLHGRSDMRLCDYFDLIGGTSAGSILAAGLATGMDMEALSGRAMALTGRIFGRRSWRTWRSVFDSKPLQAGLKDTFGDSTLGDQSLQTGLCIIAKRADTRSTWPLINHPEGQFYEMNRDILLRDAVYASAAAPFFFVPTEFEAGQGEVGAFVDGGVSMANNPSFQLFLLATLNGFPFHWRKGADQLLMVSIGTGTWREKSPVEKVVKSRAWDWTREVPTMLMADANAQTQLLMQYLSHTPTAWEIDSEVGDLNDDLLTSEPVLSYLRYNARLEIESLANLGFKMRETEVQALRSMSASKNCEKLLEIGRAAAEAQIKSEDLGFAYE